MMNLPIKFLIRCIVLSKWSSSLLSFLLMGGNLLSNASHEIVELKFVRILDSYYNYFYLIFKTIFHRFAF